MSCKCPVPGILDCDDGKDDGEDGKDDGEDDGDRDLSS